MRKLLFLLGLFLLFSFSLPAKNAPEVKHLRTEYLQNPVGIDLKKPRFSWIFTASERGAKQTAYQIIVSTDQSGNKPVWNSGRVKSGKSINNAYAGVALKPSTRYFWHVDVWDGNNKKISSSEMAFFETGLMDTGWSNARWIKATTLKQGENESATLGKVTDYTIEMDFQLNALAAGPCFGIKDTRNFFMWQINIENGNSRLRPHSWKDGNAVCHENVDITSMVEIKKGVTYTLRIDVKGDKASTYINNILVDANRVNPLGGNYGLGKVGFRSSHGEKSSAKESASFDNIKVTTKVQGVEKVLFAENFSHADDFQFTQGPVVDGRLLVDTGDDSRVFQGRAAGIPMFRKTFKLNRKVQSAKIYSSALGVYDLFINGTRVGTSTESGKVVYDELKPGWTDYNKTVFYASYDVTSLLLSGANAIGAHVASGWWRGNIARGAYGDKDLALIAKLVIRYSDGTTQTVVTDPTWVCNSDGPLRMADIYTGETYDARKESEWKKAGYDDSKWFQTAVSDDFKGTIKAFVGPSVQVRTELNRQPASITVYEGKKDNGKTYGAINSIQVIKGQGVVQLRKGQTAIYDFGQNLAGWVRFAAKAAAGTNVQIRFGEMLNDDGALERGNDGPAGSLYTANLRSAKATLNYIFKGNGSVERYHPSLTFFGFRYCEVTASADVEIQSMIAEVVGNATEEGSTFKTSSALVNQLYSNVIWGQRSNFLSVPTDCPQRDERQGWTGDTQIFCMTAAYNADVASFFHKWMGDMRDCQREDGAFPSTAPVIWGGHGQGAWAEAGIIVPWNVYLMYDDVKILTENYPEMEKYMDFLAAQKGEGYLYNGAGTSYGDWVSYEKLENRYVSVCYYAYAAQLMSKVSKALSQTKGDTYDVKSNGYAALYKKIKAEFATRYMNADGTLKEASQTAYLLALKLDLFPTEDTKSKGVAFLTDKIARNGNKLSTGFVGTGILNQTLSQCGATNTAYNLLLQRGNPSWIYSIDQGATTIWERWDSYKKDKGFHDVGMNSFNHYSYGAVEEWMYRYMAGIEPDESAPGFKHVILQPNPDRRTSLPEGQERITSVDATFQSYYGNIKSAWVIRTDGNLAYTATVPANTTATLYLPVSNSSDVVYEGATVADKAKGVTFVKRENGKAVYELQSGSYAFGVNVPIAGALSLGEKAGNPVFEGWYADPEGVIIDKQYWIYPTYSAPYEKQVFMDAYSSSDLVTWTKHSRIVDTTQVKWANKAMWAPAIIQKEKKYYLFFAANDIQDDQSVGGIGVAVADKPAGPFKDYLGKPLLDKFHNGAQPIDQFVFQDVDGQYYMIYGGWRHCNIIKLQNDFKGFTPFADGTTFKEITPEGYVEGPVMFRKNNKYYFMWSEGGWTGPDYRVAYAIGDSPFGPFKRIGLILQQDATIATGAGHHSVIQVPGTDEWYIVYHRRPLSETNGNARVTCIDKMEFDANGYIKPVVMTFEGVSPKTIR